MKRLLLLSAAVMAAFTNIFSTNALATDVPTSAEPTKSTFDMSNDTSIDTGADTGCNRSMNDKDYMGEPPMTLSNMTPGGLLAAIREDIFGVMQRSIYTVTSSFIVMKREIDTIVHPLTSAGLGERRLALAT